MSRSSSSKGSGSSSVLTGRSCGQLHSRLRLPGAAPSIPTPFIPRNAAQIGEGGRSGDTEPRHPPDAVEHHEDGIGDVILRNSDAATTTSGDDSRRGVTQSVQNHGGGAPVLRSQSKPCEDKRGLT